MAKRESTYEEMGYSLPLFSRGGRRGRRWRCKLEGPLSHEAQYGLGRVELLRHQGLRTPWRWGGLARPAIHVRKLSLLLDCLLLPPAATPGHAGPGLGPGPRVVLAAPAPTVALVLVSHTSERRSGVRPSPVTTPASAVPTAAVPVRGGRGGPVPVTATPSTSPIPAVLAAPAHTAHAPVTLVLVHHVGVVGV